jgi:hypothetical protein
LSPKFYLPFWRAAMADSKEPTPTDIRNVLAKAKQLAEFRGSQITRINDKQI